jgi:hypothetical protein
MRQCACIILGALVLGIGPRVLEAQTADPTSARRTLEAVRLEATAPVIDGRLDDAAWERAAVATDFTQSYPDPGAAATQRTEIRILYGTQHLYVGARMYDTRPDSVAAPLARRDATGLYSDWLHVMVDSRHDRRTAFSFSVNPRSVQRDVYFFDDVREDASWDAVWEGAAQVDSLGWTAELRIPFSQLRFGGTAYETRTWGLQIMRDIARRGERASWSPWTRTDAGVVSRFGTLTALEGVYPPLALELLPYATARLTRAPGDLGNPFYSRNDPGGAVGADLRLGLPLGMTLSATINPDFGQVEADPAEVNLTAFETFFSERRPFFTEGMDIFRFGDTRTNTRYGFQQYFYSRRIGRPPQRRLGGPDHVHVDAPQQTRILGAAKLSGRTPGGWTIGAMNAVTGRESARYVDAYGERHTTPVEPLSNYFVSRVRRELRDGATVVGGILTATNRELSDAVFTPFLHRAAYVAGTDFLHTWANRTWSVSGYLVGSRVEASEQAILGTQRTSARYFQRPDADHLTLDPSRSSLGGHMAELAVQRSGRWDASLQLKQASPGFEMNDLGFHGRVDYRSIAAYLGRRVDRVTRALLSHSYFVAGTRAWTFGGERIHDSYTLGGHITFRNLWSGVVHAGLRPEVLDDRMTRGGPLAAAPAQRSLFAGIESDPRRSIGFTVFTAFGASDSGAFDRTIGAGMDVRPGPALRLRLRPQLNRTRSTAQYMRVVDDTAAQRTYGRRYVFAELDQTTLAIETRLDWTFTPRLSLQLFAQPFVSAGSYRNFKEFREPRRFEFDVYGTDRGTICRYGGVYVVDPVAVRSCPVARPAADDPDFRVRFNDPDFNFRSLRGNAVLRWEYRPGSTLFFVWQQDRRGVAPLGDFDLFRDTDAIFRAPAQNVFLIKVTYWLAR